MRDYAQIYSEGRKPVIAGTSMAQIKEKLPPCFLQVHRSWIVNTEHIDEYRPNRIRIGTTEIEISRKYKEEVRIRLGKE